jgi:hypothetical protein
MEQNWGRRLALAAGIFAMGLFPGLLLGSAWVPASLEEQVRLLVPLLTFSISAMFAFLFALEVQGRTPLEVRSHWGGLGGGIGGIAISPAILHLLAALIFGVLTVVQLGSSETIPTQEQAHRKEEEHPWEGKHREASEREEHP